jgi:HSP20 family molecular chaperone IbpA
MFPDRDPFDEFDEIKRMFENMSNSSDNNLGRSDILNTYVDQSVDIDEGILTVVMDIPSVSKDNIKATVNEQGNQQWLMVEVNQNVENTTRKSRQKVALKQRVDPELADSEYNNGVLTVKFPLLDENNDSGVGIEIK